MKRIPIHYVIGIGFFSVSCCIYTETNVRSATEESVFFNDGVDWNRYAVIMATNQAGLTEKYTQEAGTYVHLLQDVVALQETLKNNRETLYAKLSIGVEVSVEKNMRDEVRSLYRSTMVESVIQNLATIIDSSQDRIKGVEQEIQAARIYSTEIQQVYKSILQRNVIKRQELEEGIVVLVAAIEGSIEARQHFLDAMKSLVAETASTIETLRKEVIAAR